MADRYQPISFTNAKTSPAKVHKDLGNGLHAEVVAESSVLALTGGQSQSVAISTTSAQSTAISANYVTLYSTADCFMRQGANPTALSDGTDQFIPAGVMLRVGITNGNMLAFKTASGTGTVYLTPGA